MGYQVNGKGSYGIAEAKRRASDIYEKTGAVVAIEYTAKIPERKMTDRFRPKADEAFLRDANQVAWQKRSDALTARLNTEAAEPIAAFLEATYPAADMVLLAKYDCTTVPRDNEINIRVRLPESDRWDRGLTVKLSRPVTVATSYQGLYCGGPRYYEMESGGLNEETAAQIKAGKHDTFASWEDYLESHRKSEIRAVPRELELLIFECIETSIEYRRDYNEINAWPKAYKIANGKYPTWQDIASKFPLVGKTIAHRVSIGWERV